MSRITLSGNASGTGNFTLASPNSNTDRTLTLPDNTGTVLTTASTLVLPKGGPAFLVYSSNTPSISNSTWTAVTFNNEEFDTASAYSTSTGRFTPQVAGYYQFSLTLRFNLASSYTGVAIYKNGGSVTGSFGTLLQLSIGANAGLNHSSLFYMNGTTDYVAAYGYTNVNSQTLSNDPTSSAFSGFLVRAD